MKVKFDEYIFKFLYPKNLNCINCQIPIDSNNTLSLCKDCFLKLRFINIGCLKCGKPIFEYEGEYCKNCKRNLKNFYFDRVISCLEYNEMAHNLIYKFKYGLKTYMSLPLSHIMLEKLKQQKLQPEFVTSIPLSKKRLKDRGFNQSELLAKKLVINKNLYFVGLRRIKNTPYLSKLNKRERKEVLKDVFTLYIDASKIKGKTVWLVDDIFTTGSTINEASKVLKLSGAKQVFGICLATGSNKY